MEKAGLYTDATKLLHKQEGNLFARAKDQPDQTYSDDCRRWPLRELLHKVRVPSLICEGDAHESFELRHHVAGVSRGAADKHLRRAP